MFRILVNIPFAPNRIIIPMPCEMEGISIGNVIKTPNKALYRTWLRAMQNARIKEMITE
jgi:hypothetical protein